MAMRKTEIEDDPRAHWILKALHIALLKGRGGIELTTSFDYGFDFIAAFGKAFPGRGKDLDFTAAKIRLYRLLVKMRNRGWTHDERLSNYDLQDPREPRWVTEWKITPRGVERLKQLDAEREAQA